MHIQFEKVSLQYGNQPILRDVTFSLEPGVRLALIGESGAGKSSLAGLLMRKRDPTSGTVRINGDPLPDYNLSSFLRHVGVILQRPEMVSGDVEENLRLALHPEDNSQVHTDDLWRVLDIISPSLRERFNGHGLQTLVGKQGLQLSGGEQQRICIARALIKNPELLIIDEATASLDGKNQAMVQGGIDTALRQGISALVIAHRFSTLRNCNRFIVLKRLSDCAESESQIEAVASSLAELHEVSATFRELAHYEGVEF